MNGGAPWVYRLPGGFGATLIIPPDTAAAVRDGAGFFSETRVVSETLGTPTERGCPNAPEIAQDSCVTRDDTQNFITISGCSPRCNGT